MLLSSEFRFRFGELAAISGSIKAPSVKKNEKKLLNRSFDCGKMVNLTSFVQLFRFRFKVWYLTKALTDRIVNP